MQQYWLLYPLIAMTAIIFFTGIKMLSERYKAVRHDGLRPEYFLLNRGGKAPEYLLKTSQHYINLFELPSLFYIVIILLYLIQQADFLDLFIACWFVITRIIHAIIHMGKNNLKQRRTVFLISTLVLFGLWCKLFVHLLQMDL